MTIDHTGRAHKPAGSPSSTGGQFAAQAAPGAAATLTQQDFWVDGHYIAARTEDEARSEAAALYDFTPDTVRPWTADDQANLDRQAEPSPIRATFQPQQWVNDYAVDDGPAVPFDIREVLDSFSLEQLRRQDADDNDDLFATEAQGSLIDEHDGPFYLRIDEEQWETYLAEREAEAAAEPAADEDRQARAEIALKGRVEQRLLDETTAAIQSLAKLNPTTAHHLLLQQLGAIEHPHVDIFPDGTVIDPHTGARTHLVYEELRVHERLIPTDHIDTAGKQVPFVADDLDGTGKTRTKTWFAADSGLPVSLPADYTIESEFVE